MYDAELFLRPHRLHHNHGCLSDTHFTAYSEEYKPCDPTSFPWTDFECIWHGTFRDPHKTVPLSPPKTIAES